MGILSVIWITFKHHLLVRNFAGTHGTLSDSPPIAVDAIANVLVAGQMDASPKILHREPAITPNSCGEVIDVGFDIILELDSGAEVNEGELQGGVWLAPNPTTLSTRRLQSAFSSTEAAEPARSASAGSACR